MMVLDVFWRGRHSAPLSSSPLASFSSQGFLWGAGSLSGVLQPVLLPVPPYYSCPGGDLSIVSTLSIVHESCPGVLAQSVVDLRCVGIVGGAWQRAPPIFSPGVVL
jgi:hypothetical protein